MRSLEIRVRFKDTKHAEMIRECMSVDEEPRPDKIARHITVPEPGCLCITYKSQDVKLIRTASSGFLENLNLAVQVVSELSPEALA